MKPLNITARRQIRLAVVAALERAGLSVGDTEVRISSPGNWPLQAGLQPDTVSMSLPAVLVRYGAESKEPKNKGLPEFDTTVAIEVKAIVQGFSAEQVQDDLDALVYQVEEAILTFAPLLGVAQQSGPIESQIEIRGESRETLGAYTAVFSFESFEAFDITAPAPQSAATWPGVPSPIAPLTQITTTLRDAPPASDILATQTFNPQA